jgi:hypothetical protein
VRALTPLAAAAVLLGVVGCSADESSGSRSTDPEVADARAGLAALFAGDHPGPRDTANGECFAEELTSTTSLDALREAGVLDASYGVVEDLPALRPDVAEAWADAQFACTDFVEESTRAQQAATKGGVDGEAYAACLRGALDEAEMKAAVVDSLVGNWQGPALLSLGRAQSDCAEDAVSR